MDGFKDILSETIANKAASDISSKLQGLGSFRPTLYIGLGGFGCMVARKVKNSIYDIIDDDSIRNGFNFIGMDTHPYDEKKDVLSKNEYVPLSIGVHPNTVARQQSEFLDWYLDLVGKWDARNITCGADKVKAVGRFSLINPATLADFGEKLNRSFNQLIQFRSNFSGTIPIKIYIISTLAGGTGAGCLLDTFIIAREYAIKQLGPDTKIQGIIATPDVLEGEANRSDLRDFYTNTYASMKEIYHFVQGEQEVFKYSDPSLSSVRIGSTHIPNPLYVITDRNEDNRAIVKTIEELADATISYLLYEIKTPMQNLETGQPKPQDNENPLYDSFGHGNSPKAFSSFGVVQAGIPHDILLKIFSHYIIQEALFLELSSSNMREAASSWIFERNLAEAGSDQLQEEIRKDREGHAIRSSIDTEGKLADVNRMDLPNACDSLKKSTWRSLEEQIKPTIKKNATDLAQTARDDLNKEFKEIVNHTSLGSAIAMLRELNEEFKVHKAALNNETSDARLKLVKAEEQVDSGIKNVAMASAGGIFGRRNNIRIAISALDGDLEIAANLQINVWSKEEGLDLYENVIAGCDDLLKIWNPVYETLNARLSYSKHLSKDFEIYLEKAANINERGSGNRFSLINLSKAKTIYQELVEGDVKKAIARRAREQWIESGCLMNASEQDKNWIDRALEPIEVEMADKLESHTLMEYLERFYPDELSKKELFSMLASLASPLFPIDVTFKEADYQTYWVVAMHPKIKQDTQKLCRKYLASSGLMSAHFETPYEIIIYCIQHGYTLHSLKRKNHYLSNYNNISETYKSIKAKQGKVYRPIHGWIGAEYWNEIGPDDPNKELIYRWFILGRAFNRCFPSQGSMKADGSIDNRKNKSFISNRGSNYYLVISEGGKEKLVGKSLEEAIENFSMHLDWIDRIKQAVETKQNEIGEQVVQNKLETEYLPVLEKERVISERNKDKKERAEILHDLKESLIKYIKEELRPNAV